MCGVLSVSFWETLIVFSRACFVCTGMQMVLHTPLALTQHTEIQNQNNTNKKNEKKKKAHTKQNRNEKYKTKTT